MYNITTFAILQQVRTAKFALNAKIVLTNATTWVIIEMSHDMRNHKIGGEKVVNVNKLKAKLVEREMNIETLAEKIGMDRATLYRRFSDGNKFTIGEAESICKELDLTADEVHSIFFAQYVA